MLAKQEYLRQWNIFGKDRYNVDLEYRFLYGRSTSRRIMQLAWNAAILQRRQDEEAACYSTGIYTCALLTQSSRQTDTEASL
jgi:hypothetical protein